MEGKKGAVAMLLLGLVALGLLAGQCSARGTESHEDAPGVLIPGALMPNRLGDNCGCGWHCECYNCLCISDTKCYCLDMGYEVVMKLPTSKAILK